MSIVKQLNLILGIRRAILSSRKGPLAPGSNTLLAPWYNNGLDMVTKTWQRSSDARRGDP
eukprot:7208330-Lingulodinium_polyedra.AAC.1